MCQNSGKFSRLRSWIVNASFPPWLPVNTKFTIIFQNFFGIGKYFFFLNFQIYKSQNCFFFFLNHSQCNINICNYSPFNLWNIIFSKIISIFSTLFIWHFPPLFHTLFPDFFKKAINIFKFDNHIQTKNILFNFF